MQTLSVPSCASLTRTWTNYCLSWVDFLSVIAHSSSYREWVLKWLSACIEVLYDHFLVLRFILRMRNVVWWHIRNEVINYVHRFLSCHFLRTRIFCLASFKREAKGSRILLLPYYHATLNSRLIYTTAIRDVRNYLKQSSPAEEMSVIFIKSADWCSHLLSKQKVD